MTAGILTAWALTAGILTAWPARAAKIVAVTALVVKVSGMSCEHCATAVRTEIGGLAGVTAVDVDVASGEVKIVADPVPDDAALRAAVDAAGYELAR